MHIPDGFLSPAVCVGTGTIAAGTLAVAFRKLDATLASRTVPLTGMVASLIFAGQMVNFPIGLPVSGHLIGGTLAAILLGPWGGCVALALVLFVQMALFSDGGWLAYGANVFNMGVVGSLGGYALYHAVRSRIAGPRGVLLGGMLAGWGSVMAAAACFCLEFWLSHPAGEFDLRQIWMLMASFHSLIGVGEALITGMILSVVLVHRPELVAAQGTSTNPARIGRFVWTGVVAALIVAAFAAPFASEYGDGLEAVAEEAGFASRATESTGPLLNDYPGTDPESPLWGKVATAMAGLLGTTVVLLLGWGLCQTLPRSLTPREDVHAG
ncbi:MAG: energy-coupling factor ABC transporter permease [Planctomycetota bacterium]|nr:energy-coupling factor ABC transporter permease [Planctomycetota bacterium]